MHRTALALGAATALLSATSAQALDIELNFDIGPEVDPALAAQAQEGFEEASRIWERTFLDPITVRIDAGFESLAPNVLGQTGSTSATVPFTSVRDAMAADARSPADRKAVANLPDGESISFFTNTLGTDTGVDTVAFDSVETSGFSTVDNTQMNVNTANLKALGFAGLDGVTDGNVTFSSDFNFDFDRSDGIAPDAIDFVGVAVHEIGHALGFVSGVDVVDVFTGLGPGAQQVRELLADAGIDPANLANANIFELLEAFFNLPDNFNAVFSPLDLFRFSDLSFDEAGNFLGFDFTTGLGVTDPLTFEDFDQRLANRTDIPFFSIDGGETAIAPLAMGAFNGGSLFRFPNGDIIQLGGSQASHFFADFGVIDPFGIMDPNFAFGEFGRIRSADLTAFDVIGFDIPVPASIAFLGAGLAGLGLLARRRRSS